jgi:hypothetical protein
LAIASLFGRQLHNRQKFAPIQHITCLVTSAPTARLWEAKVELRSCSSRDRAGNTSVLKMMSELSLLLVIKHIQTGTRLQH